jgi:uncharacterized membrane protein YdbT with pleckstrin-like domain
MPEVVLWEAVPTLKPFVVEACLLVLAWVALWSSVDDILSYLASSYWQIGEVLAGRRTQAGIFVAGLVSSAAIARLARLAFKAVGVRCQRYHLSNRRLRIEGGVFSKSVREIDVRSIDDILLHQSLLGRMLGVGEIALVASETDDKGPRNKLRLQAIRDPQVARDQIREAAYRAS